MLAYVFWHWRRPEADAAGYARSLIAFHEALRREPPLGFHDSATFRSGGAPWIPAEESYEDWYLVEGSAALDPLNAAAVAGVRRDPHDAAARAAAGGAAGLYRLRLGVPKVADARQATWFSKPPGVGYEDFYSWVAPLAGAGGASGLWGRQMTLGPTPEFCLLSPGPERLPDGLQGFTRPIELLWPRG